MAWSITLVKRIKLVRKYLVDIFNFPLQNHVKLFSD